MVVLLFSSCSWRVIENGQYKGPVLAPPARDSILILSLSNVIPIPASSLVVSHIIIKGPWQKSVDHDQFVVYARNEAARLGGNVVKINQFHGLTRTKWLRQAIYATIYRMDEPDLAHFNRQLNLAKQHYADSMRSMAIVHIRDRDMSGKRVLYFDDSVVTRIHGVGFDGMRNPGTSDLVFRRNGVLRIEPAPPSLLDIELGNEYFILLYSSTSRRGYVYQYELMDKEHFYYKLR